MATVLADATVFPIAPDGEVAVQLAHAWRTNVMPTESGAEVRSSWRAVPVRRLAYTALFESTEALGQFRARWLGAPERLRYLVPLWSRAAAVTALPDASTIGGAFANLGFVAGAQTAILWLSESAYELVDVETVTDDAITLAAPIVASLATYPVGPDGPTRLLPVMRAWLEAPTLEQLSASSARVPLVFSEELPGVAGTDPAVGAGLAPVAARIESYQLQNSSPWGGRILTGNRVVVFDAGNVPIPNAPLTWSLSPAVVAPAVVTFPGDGDTIHLDYTGNAFSGYTITVTSGAASLVFADR